MYNIFNSRNYIVIKDIKELNSAKNCDLCRFIIFEDNNVIYIWVRAFGKWTKEKYVVFGETKGKDENTTGLKAYQNFYYYCGKEEVERMKKVFPCIPLWESYEQMHYANIDYIGEKIYQDIYEFDANSAFTYGVMQLPEEFNLLKEYMIELYNKKESSTNSITRSKYKNLQNYLIGYFARIKEFVAVRSEIIKRSNENVKLRMAEIVKNKGKVFLSNTDSIITDSVGAEVMGKYYGHNVGQFKLELKTDKLFYKSPNAYQIGEKIVYSGVKYFARKHTDFFEEKYAMQSGSLIRELEFSIDATEEGYKKLCRVSYGEITVTVFNSIGETIETIKYKIK